ncbi:MAG: hypothetical protein ACK4K7_03045 [Allosphingosinicella sp.]|uniref:hypothetical protein n=1 Tax=Allosphingosinicella sp. TaxID=2823234 RepID=UPI003931F573
MHVVAPPPGPEWITLLEAVPAEGDEPARPALRIEFAPITRAMRRRAHTAARKILIAAGADAAAGDLDLLADAGDAISVELIRLGARNWDGVGDQDGNPLPFTPEAMDWLLADDRLFELADEKYVKPWADREAEKNGSPASPSGTGEAGTQAADIAGSAADTEPPPPNDATDAPTASKSPAPRRRKKSGS